MIASLAISETSFNPAGFLHEVLHTIRHKQQNIQFNTPFVITVGFGVIAVATL